MVLFAAFTQQCLGAAKVPVLRHVAQPGFTGVLVSRIRLEVLHGSSAPFPICFSKAARISPLPYSRSSTVLTLTSTCPFPLRPRFVPSLPSPFPPVSSSHPLLHPTTRPSALA